MLKILKKVFENKKINKRSPWKKTQKLISVPVCLFRTLEYPLIKFGQKFQSTLLLKPPLVLET